MILLQVKDLVKAYGAYTVLDHVSFIVGKGDKIGLIGSNGAGKTTLFRCITGEDAMDNGHLTLTEGVRYGYLEQIPEFAAGITLFEAVMEMYSDVLNLRGRLRDMELSMGTTVGKSLTRIMEDYSTTAEAYEKAGGFGCEASARRVIVGLGFSQADLTSEVNTMSGGEKTRVCLARLLVREPDILLLDEPTNHLDLQAVEWLEGYLKGYNGSMLVISHDRYFLDQVTNRTLELENGRLESFKGSYSSYLIQKEELEFALSRAYERQQKEIKATEDYINKYRAGIKAKQARGRQSILSRLERLDTPVNGLNISLGKELSQAEHAGNMVLRVNDLGFGFKDRKLFEGLSFNINKGEKVALIGGNGTGKSTVLKIIVGELKAIQGQTDLGARVKIGYFDQEHAGLNDNSRIIDELTHSFAMSEEQARDRLGAFLFRGDDVYKPVRILSGGEKGRLAFLKLFLSGPNFMVLDEPTNHLDIRSRDVIESFLKDFGGTILVVSHDRYFLDRITGRTLELVQGKLYSYLGSYTYYKAKKAELLKDGEAQTTSKPKAVSIVVQADKKKINKSKTRGKIALIEKNIETAEERLQRLSELLADPAVYQNGTQARELVDEYKRLERQVPELYEEWENLTELLEEV